MEPTQPQRFDPHLRFVPTAADAAPGRDARALERGLAMETLSQLDLPWIKSLVHERAGIRLEDAHAPFLSSRLAALAVEEGFDHLPALIESLHTEPANGVLHRRVVEALAVSETSFFRDLHPFEALRTTIVPKLIKDREKQRRLRIWSAACASGQEPYSLAMMIRHHFPELSGWQVTILATDFSRASLARAREGRFTQVEVNRGLPAAMLLRYFEKRDADWHVRDEVRSMVTFREHNLVLDEPPTPPVDVALMRNVLIYFDRATRREVLRRTAPALEPGGVLILGGGESVDVGDAPYDIEQVGRVPVLRARDPRFRAPAF